MNLSFLSSLVLHHYPTILFSDSHLSPVQTLRSAMAKESFDDSVTETKTLLDYGLEIVSEKTMDLSGSKMANSQHREKVSFDVGKMLEQLERDLVEKEVETLSVLNQLEATRKYVQGLKADFMAVSSSCSLVDNHHPACCTESMLSELMRTQSSFNRASLALSIIQASLESLNKKMRIDELMVMNMDSDHLKKMRDASRYEMGKAIREIERTKNSIIIAEMRLNAAKKMEEAAKAVEAIAVAERSVFSTDPLQETKFIDKTIIARSGVDGYGDMKGHEAKLQEPDRGIYYNRTHGENGPHPQPDKHKQQHRNSRSAHRQNTGSKSKNRLISIGAILTGKLISTTTTTTSKDDDEVMTKRLLKCPKEEQQHHDVSLSQRWLKEPYSFILNLSRRNIENQ